MAGNNPQMIVRIAANVDELKRNLAEGKSSIEALGPSVQKMADRWAASSAKLVQDAHNITAAVQKVGASTLTAGDAGRALRTIDAAMAQLKATGQTVPPTMQAVANSLRAVQTQAVQTDSALSMIGKQAAGVLSGMVGFQLVTRGFGELTDFIKSSVAAYAESEQAQKRLDTAMKTTGTNLGRNAEYFKALAAEMQRTTAIEDDAVSGLIATGLQLGILPTQMEGVIKASQNMAAGLGMDVEQAMRLLVKANNDTFTAFQRLGISIDTVRAKAEGLPYIIDQLNKGMGGQAAAEIETYSGQVKQLANEFNTLQETVGEMTLTFASFGGGVKGAVDLLRGVNTVLGDMENNWGKLLWASRSGTMGIVQGLKDIGAMKPKLDTSGIEDGMAGSRAVIKDTQQVITELLKSLDKYKQESEPIWRKQEADAKKAAEKTKEWRDNVRDLTFVLTLGSQSLGNLSSVVAHNSAEWTKNKDTIHLLYARDLPMMIVGLAGVKTAAEQVNLGEAFEKMEKEAAEATKKTKEAFQKNLGAAISVVDELSRAAEMSGHRTTAALLSAGSAIAKGFASGPWAGVMASIGVAIGALAKLFGKAEGRKVNDMRDEFIAAAGGLAALNEKARQAGMSLDRLLKASTVKEYEKAVEELNKALEKTAALQAELAGLQQQLQDRTVMDWKKAQEVIERYGGTLGNLGKQFTDAKAAADWKSVWDDWETLIDMGADVGGVLVSMKDEISALVAESVRVGREIPAQFKPLIEELARTGQLIDSNGDAMTDLGQLKWGAPLISEVDKIIAKIDELIEALSKGLVGAFEEVGRTRVPPVKIPYEFENVTSSGEAAGYSHGGVVYAAAGWRARGTDVVPAMLTPGERVLTVAQNRDYERFMASGSANVNQTIRIPVVLDGRQITEVVIRRMANRLSVAGVPVG